MTHWYVGQRVRCLGMIEKPEMGQEFPVRGGEYTIREICDHGHGPGFRLVEIRNADEYFPYLDLTAEIYFSSTRFRPIVKTDISVFTSMLSKPPVPKRVPADA